MATWNHMIIGAACVVQVKSGGGIPNIPGSLKNDVVSVGTPLDSSVNAYKVSDYIKNIWGTAGLNKNYTTLTTKSALLSQLAYYFAGAYPGKGGGSFSLQINIGNASTFEYYVSSNVYYISRPSHRGEYFGKDTGVINISIIYTDGTSYSTQIKNRYVGTSHDPFGVWNPRQYGNNVYKTERLPKAIKTITVSASYPSGGGQWHDDFNRTWYKNSIISAGLNSFPNNFYGNYALENKMDFTARTGYLVEKTEPVQTLVK